MSPGLAGHSASQKASRALQTHEGACAKKNNVSGFNSLALVRQRRREKGLLAAGPRKKTSEC